MTEETVAPKPQYGSPEFPTANSVAKGEQRRALKQAARANFKKKYWTIVLICIFMAFFCGEFPGTLQLPDSHRDSNIVVAPTSALETLEETVSPFDEYGIFGVFLEYTTAGQAIVNNVDTADRGILAGLFKSHDFTGFLQMFSDGYSLIQGILHKTAATADIVIVLGGMLLSLLLAIFVWSIIIVGERRFFLENRMYSDVSPTRTAFIYGERATRHVAWVMLLQKIKLTLWALTLVGGPIKLCEYAVIPYILAENPDIPTKDCFVLARRMMMGHKWEYMKLLLSFWYWDLASLATMGLVRIFFLNGYFRASETEFYVAVREDALVRNVPLAEYLDDKDLYNPPEPDMETYPGTVRKHVESPIHVNYKRHYTLLNLALMFFIFSMVGWFWEVGLHLAQDHEFVNRGTMLGPWLPIYGCGGLLILICLSKFRNHPMLHFVAAMVLCGALEYFTSWYLETTKGMLWWDYTGYLLNLNGRICLEGLLAFAIGGTLFVYLLAPLIDDLLLKIPKKGRIGLLVVFAVLFGADTAYSSVHPNTGKGITDYDREAALAETAASSSSADSTGS